MFENHSSGQMNLLMCQMWPAGVSGGCRWMGELELLLWHRLARGSNVYGEGPTPPLFILAGRTSDHTSGGRTGYS